MAGQANSSKNAKHKRSSESSESQGPPRRKVKRTFTQSEEVSTNDPENNNVAVFARGAGNIEKIILRNFLCHDELKFENLSPKLNLLQGKNGSGKSAVVAALIVGLGGSTRSADRGNNLKGLIQNGKNTAVITIFLNNKGYMAYKPELFGASIIIERKLRVSGVNTFKVKSLNGSVVGTKKDYLTKILDWFNIQVDNPITILSQERAKSFLSSTDPKDLFNFFMAATFLKQLKEDIAEIKKEIYISNQSIEKNLKSLPDMKREVNRWKEKSNTIMTLIQKLGKIRELKGEKAWAEVQEVENDLSDVRVKIQNSEANKNKYSESLTKYNMKEKELMSHKKETDDKVTTLLLKSKENEAKKQELYNEVKGVRMNFRTTETKKNSLRKELADKQRDIDDLSNRLNNDYHEIKKKWDNDHRLIEEKRSEIVQDMQSVKDNLETKQVEISHLSQTVDKSDEELNHRILEHKAMKSRYEDLKRQLAQLQSVNNSLAVFGRYIPQIVEEIERSFRNRRFTTKPIGPLGRHIKVKDQRWVHIAESILGGCINAFAVHNMHDYNELTNIFRIMIPESEPKPKVIVCRFRDQVHNFKSRMTGTPEYNSLFAILDVDNVHVVNTILDETSCESILLIPTSEEAIYLLRDRCRVPVNCKSAQTLHGDTILPDPNFKIYSGSGNKQVKYLQVSVEDRIRDLNGNISSTEQECIHSEGEIREYRQQIKNLKTERSLVQKKIEEFEIKRKHLYNRLMRLENEVQPPPPDVYQLQKDLEEQQGAKAKIIEKITAFDIQLRQIGEEKKEKEELSRQFELQCKELLEDINNIREDETGSRDQLTDVKKKIMVLSSKIGEFKKTITDSNNVSRQLEKKLNTLMESAEKNYPERVTSTRSKAEIDRDLTNQNTAVAKVQEMEGKNPKAVGEIYIQKNNKLIAIEKEVDSQKKFIKLLKQSLVSRIELYDINKKLQRSSINNEFNNKVCLRNFEGLIDLNYDTETLKIMVSKLQTDKRNTSKISHNSSKLEIANRFQSLKMMSGGERSFATVSFLVALWSVTGSPLTVLDEFDIFMDCVSKSQIVDIIINSLQNAQYILVSPQEYRMSGKEISVFRMEDPERVGSRASRVDNNSEEED